MARRTFNSIESTADQAEALVAAGPVGRGRAPLPRADRPDPRHRLRVRRLAAPARRDLPPPGRAREAGVRLPLPALLRPGARTARRATSTSALRARLAEIEKKWTEAAQLYQQAQLPVHAAVAFEKAKQYTEARAAWEALLHARRARAIARTRQALVHFNYGLAAVRLDAASGGGAPRADREPAQARAGRRRLRDRSASSSARSTASRSCSSSARNRRSSRTSPRATSTASACCATTTSSSTSCSTTRTSSSSRSSAASCTRRRRSTRRPPTFAARAGLPYDRHYQHKSALTWMRCADKFVETGVPVQMVENALLAAASQHSAVGDYPAVRECFERLAGLELPDRAKKRFSTIAQRYKGLAAPPVELPGLARLPQAAARLRRHLVRRSARVGDGRRSVRGRGVDRRRPALSRTASAGARWSCCSRSPTRRRRNAEGETETLVHVAELLGELQSYAALSPLEKLYARERSGDPPRRGARAALPLLQALVRDRAQGARRSATRRCARPRSIAIGGLHFPHAFNPLARIYRESNDPRVRSAALESIGKIQTRRGRRVPRHGAAPGGRRRCARRRTPALAQHRQRRRAADPAPAPRDRDEPAGARDARRAAAPALTRCGSQRLRDWRSAIRGIVEGTKRAARSRVRAALVALCVTAGWLPGVAGHRRQRRAARAARCGRRCRHRGPRGRLARPLDLLRRDRSIRERRSRQRQCGRLRVERRRSDGVARRRLPGPHRSARLHRGHGLHGHLDHAGDPAARPPLVPRLSRVGLDEDRRPPRRRWRSCASSSRPRASGASR